MLSKVGRSVQKSYTSGAMQAFPKMSHSYRCGYNPVQSMTPEKLFEKIIKEGFKPAKSIYEAEQVARGIGIGSLRIKDLNIANFINEGLVEYRKITGKKLPRIDIITDRPFGRVGESVMMQTGIKNSKRFIYVNEKYFNGDYTNTRVPDYKTLQDILKSPFLHLTREQKNLLGIAMRKPYSLTPFQKETLDKLVENQNYSKTDNLFCYLGLLNTQDTAKIARNARIPHFSIEDFQRLRTDGQNRYLGDLLNAGCKISFNDRSRFNVLFHEIGHINHENKIGTRRLNKMYKGFDGDLYERASSPYELESTRIFSKKQSNHPLTSYISTYAMTCPGEFVAEMYSGMLDGNKYCKELNDMYKAYHGPRLPILTKIKRFLFRQ